jgi:opacity protein-like surface antigen
MRSWAFLMASGLVLGLVSCGGAEEAPTTEESGTDSTTDSTEAVAPVPPTQDAPTATTAAAPATTPAGASTFASENFTITITGFGLEAAYRGCDQAGQCLEIPRASAYDNGSYTWENAGYTYQMGQVVGGDYRLEVRDPEGKVLVDEVARFVETSEPSATAAQTESDVVEMVDLTLWNLTPGDRGCYVELVDASQTHFTELGVFELCERTDLITQFVRVSMQEQSVMAASCQGDPDCTATEIAPVIIDIRPE